ncbi:hypothetical protein BH23VER1_BH23VER1_21300 [soil metagenome]
MERGDLAAVAALLEEGTDVEVRTPDGITPLFAAAYRDRTDIIRVLVKSGARVDAPAALGRTALFAAAGEGNGRSVGALLELGADPNARSEKGDLVQTALHIAASLGRIKTARHLIEVGAMVNARDERYGMTPLHLAVLGGHQSMARVLRDHGADSSLADAFGQSPEQAAAVMEARKTRQLMEVPDRRMGFDPRAIVVLPYLAESQGRRRYGGNRVGVAIGDGTLVATAAHCLDDFSAAGALGMFAKPLVFSPYFGDVFEAEIVGTDAAADVALLRVSWDSHPSLALATHQEVKEASEVMVAGHPLPERGEAAPGASRTVWMERLPVLSVQQAAGPSQVTLGGARYIGPGWSGSAMILPNSGRLGGIFCRRDDASMDGLVVLQNRGCAGVQSIRDLMKEKGLQTKEPPAEWKGPEDATEGFSAALAWLDAQAARPPEEGIAAATRFLQLRSDSGQAHRLLAYSASGIRGGSGDELAEKHYREAVRLAPDSFLVRASRACFLDTRGRPEEALEELAKAAAMDTHDPFIQGTRLKILADLRPEEAGELGRRLVEEAPENAVYRFHYAGALRELGRIDEALDAAQAAVRLATEENFYYRGRLADLLARCNRLDEAEVRYRELLDHQPDSPMFWCWYAQFLQERGPERLDDLRSAIEHCDKLNKPPVLPEDALDALRQKIDASPDPVSAAD